MKKKLTRTQISQLGGQAGTGKAKRRGSAAMYSKLAARRWRKSK